MLNEEITSSYRRWEVDTDARLTYTAGQLNALRADLEDIRSDLCQMASALRDLRDIYVQENDFTSTKCLDDLFAHLHISDPIPF